MRYYDFKQQRSSTSLLLSQVHSADREPSIMGGFSLYRRIDYSVITLSHFNDII